jgi:antitoxin component of MazEF toxin-antitoxin module
MKLQKQLSRKVGNITYPKYVVVIPPQIIEEVGFKEGDELEAKASKGEIRLKRK